MAAGNFPLSLIVDVTVNIGAVGNQPPTFNQGLIIGSSAIIPSATRLQLFTSANALLLAGFNNTSPEYIAAVIYFGANPAPQYLWVGRQDLTAISTIQPHSGNAGTNYVVGDIVGIVQSGGSLGKATVTALGSNGAVTALSVTPQHQGTGYAVATALTTTGGSGTGLQVDITSIGETILQAVQSCRIASPSWYMCGACGAGDSDALAVAAYAQSATPQMIFVYNTSTFGVTTGLAGNVALTLQANSYNRIFTQYTTTQSGAYPNQIYFFAAIMGKAMGLNTGLANSYFTMKFKPMVGMVTEPISQTQANFAETANANLYLSYTPYTFEEQGVVANGQFLDEIIFLDMLGAQIQYNCMNVFVGVPSVPQTDGGESLLINAVQQACVQLQTIGFIAPSGVWNGQQVLNLTTGKSLPNGFLIQAPSFATQSPANNLARQMMPIYVAIVESGSGHSVLIGVYVQR